MKESLKHDILVLLIGVAVYLLIAFGYASAIASIGSDLYDKASQILEVCRSIQ